MLGSAAKWHCCFAAKAKSGHSLEDIPAAAVGNSPAGNAEPSHTAVPYEVVGLAILPMATPQAPPSTHPIPTSTCTINADLLDESPQASSNSKSQMQHCSSSAHHLQVASSDSSVISNKRLWVLPLASLLEDQTAGLAHEGVSGQHAKQCRALLRHVLTGNSSTVCLNMQGQLSTFS